jgi:2-phosphoglycerate kinase
MSAVIEGMHLIPEAQVQSFATEEQAVSVFVAAQSRSVLRTL